MAQKFSFDQKITSSKDVVIEELEGESVLLNLQTEKYFGLDDVGTRMWHSLIENDSIQSALDALQVEYNAQPEQLQQDIQDLIARLLENGLVEMSTPKIP